MELVINRFLKAVKQNPDRIAVREKNRSITYSKLGEAVLSLSVWLQDQKLIKGDRVGIHLPNSIEYIALYYACWQANLVPVAMNTFANYREVSIWAESAECKLLVSNVLTDKAPQLPLHTLNISSNEISINGRQIINITTPPALLVSQADVATIIYTSGTTGNPKGITLLHSNLSSNVDAIIQSLSIVNNDVFLCVLPFFYSFGNSILHTHLAKGATLVLLNQLTYPNEILKWIDNYECTGFAGVPSIYTSLLKRTQFSDYNLSTLRYMTQAGGPLSKSFIDQIYHQLPAIDFIVMYGQTEASARISYLPSKYLQSKLGSVGLGVEGVHITIEKEDGSQCLPNDKGQVCVQGKNIMQGYWNNPEETQRVLKNGKLYTGDIGYKDEEGFLYIVGRQAEILKISEHRVSPYEIEEQILQHKAVEECAVIGCSHPQMGQFAKAYVVKNDNEVDIIQLKRFCKERLAKYKIPKEIVFIASLPKTPSGKVKRIQLSC